MNYEEKTHTLQSNFLLKNKNRVFKISTKTENILCMETKKTNKCC